AVNEALKATGQNLAGKNAVIVAKGEIFAEALKKDLENQGLKVKISKPDRALAGLTKQADVLVVILGQKKFITKNMVKPEAIIIDIGTNLIGENKFVGDASPEVAEVAGFLTPVPGGIGPLTVAMLLKNVYELAKNNQ
ncbi:MAG: bifunctional 5,10-methylene-tetrahydrofolate dehydrogenase/5,10-methylene-tetrahydrofolate cyclohydrolase, partial [Patescibacteria group bacterium]